MSGSTDDLNQVITSAVQARIETEMVKALSGDEVIGQFVTAALTRKVPNRDSYDRTPQRTYIQHILANAFEEAARSAVKDAVEAEREKIQAEVERELRKAIKSISGGMVEALAKAAGSPYGLKLELKFPNGLDG